LLTLLAITYLKVYAINPKLGQSEASWELYLKSEQFRDF
jgi:hypothetical protein